MSTPRHAGGNDSSVRERILEAAFAAFMQHGYAATSTLEIASRARVSKRELYAVVGNKQEMLVACIRERATRLEVPVDLPPPRSHDDLERVLVDFGTQLLRETTDPTVVAVFRLAIAEAVRAPEVARALDSFGRQTSRAALAAIMAEAKFGWDERFGLWKLNPLADWDDKQVWNYIKDHHVPYNPLHDQGYPSIGCTPCTTPVQIGEIPRAGRWRGKKSAASNRRTGRPWLFARSCGPSPSRLASCW